jgi:hypothetical protein
MLATPSLRGASVVPVLVAVLIAAAIVCGYLWFRTNTANTAASDLRLSPSKQGQVVPWPKRHWSYGPVDQSTDTGHLSTSARP